MCLGHKNNGGALKRIWDSIFNASSDNPPPSIDRTGKVHGDLPDHPPASWTDEQLKDLAGDLDQSIKNREQEQARLGEDPGTQGEDWPRAASTSSDRKAARPMTRDPTSQRGDQLLERIRAGEDGDAANDLLKEMFRGFPVERLRELLESSDERAVKSGAWIASELGASFAPLMAEARRLLEHPVPQVRFFALDVLLVNGTEHFADELGLAAALVDDPEESVRWKATRFLARATDAQLAAARTHVPDAMLARELEWLSRSEARDAHEIEERLKAGERLTRRFAAAAAARVETDDSPLNVAAQSDDPEIRAFAADELELRKVQR